MKLIHVPTTEGTVTINIEAITCIREDTHQELVAPELFCKPYKSDYVKYSDATYKTVHTTTITMGQNWVTTTIRKAEVLGYIESADKDLK